MYVFNCLYTQSDQYDLHPGIYYQDVKITASEYGVTPAFDIPLSKLILNIVQRCFLVLTCEANVLL